MKVTLKLATSLDGKIATSSGESRWITGPESRRQVHRLRLAYGAVLVGVETVIADDPELTVRLEGPAVSQPSRIVLDTRQRIPQASKLVATADRIPTLIMTAAEPAGRLVSAGVKVIRVAEHTGRVDLAAALEALARTGLEAVLVEGGGQVAASFLAADLVDALEWFRAPIVLGGEGRPSVGALLLDELARAPRFRRLSVEPLGDDLWERYERI